jgi:prepilin-type N-terminal cleavage/methylation domain-containing protein
MDHSGQSGDKVTYPQGLARFPNNRPIAFGGSILLILTFAAWIFMLKRLVINTNLIEVMIVIVIIGILAFSVLGQLN